MQGQGTRTARTDETSVLIFAVLVFLVFASLGFVGRIFAPFSKGPVGWELMTPGTAYTILRSHVSGPACLEVLQQATVEMKGRDADVTVPGMGKVSVQSRLYAEYTLQPLTPLQDVEGCHWNPPVPFEWLR